MASMGYMPYQKNKSYKAEAGDLRFILELPAKDIFH
jgi:hypothetical protein